MLLAAFVTILNFTSAISATVLNYAILGDAGRYNEKVQTIRRSLIENKVTDLILPGDNLYITSSTYEATWDPFKNSGFQFPVVALGNHNGGYPAEMKYFKMPSEFYMVEKPGVRFYVLNSDNTKTVSEQMAWLDSELSRIQPGLVFLVYHHPTFTVAPYHNWKEKEVFQLAIRKLLVKYKDKITALLLGHDHVATVVDVSGITLIVSGAAQELRNAKDQDHTDGEFKVKTLWNYKMVPTWARLTLEPETAKARVSFINATNGTISCDTVIHGKGKTAELSANCKQ